MALTPDKAFAAESKKITDKVNQVEKIIDKWLAENYIGTACSISVASLSLREESELSRRFTKAGWVFKYEKRGDNSCYVDLAPIISD